MSKTHVDTGIDVISDNPTISSCPSILVGQLYLSLSTHIIASICCVIKSSVFNVFFKTKNWCVRSKPVNEKQFNGGYRRWHKGFSLRTLVTWVLYSSYDVIIDGFSLYKETQTFSCDNSYTDIKQNKFFFDNIE